MSPVVMIVDDSRAMRHFQREIVSQLDGVEIIEAEDGVDAAHKMRERNFAIDLILLDWVMPRMDGLSLARRIKGNARLSSIPILMVTSLSDEGRIRAAIEAGVEGYLLKPFTKEMLLRSIVSLLSPGESDGAPAEPPTAPEEVFAQGNSLLQVLSHDLRLKILASCETSEAAAGSVVAAAGSEIEHFMFILSGTVEEHVSGGEQAQTVAVYGAGDSLGVTELMTGDPLQTEFVAVEAAAIARLPKADFELLLLDHPVFTMTLSRYLASRSRSSALPESERGEGQTLHGSLEVLDLPGLIQALHLRQSTGVLEFPGLEATIEISSGQVVSATHPAHAREDGAEAFFAIVEARPRTFRYLPVPLRGERTIMQNTTELLLGCMRRMPVE